MVNFGINFGSILGLFDILIAISILVMTLIWLLGKNRPPMNRIGFYIAQIILCPMPLLLAGMLFLFHGWRLDPTLGFAVFCLNAVVVFLLVKDFFVYRNR